MLTTQTLLVLIAIAGLWLQMRRPAGAMATAPAATVNGPGGTTGQLTGRLSLAQVFNLAQRTVSTYGLDADPTMLAIMAFTESSGNASIGVHPDGVSIGLMGVTEAAARDNANRGHLVFAASRASLMTAEGSMYHAAAYVSWLRSWGGQARPDEFVIRAYNAGPTGASNGGGAAHLAAYGRRKTELGL